MISAVVVAVILLLGLPQHEAAGQPVKPDDPETHFQLGVFFDRQQAHVQAVEAFRRVLALRPADARAWDYLALHLEAMGQIDEAESAYRRGLAVNSGALADRFLDYNFGRLLAKRNRLEESLTHLDRADTLAPGTRAIHYERARVLLRLGRSVEARAGAEKALSLADPAGFILDLQVYTLLVQVYSRLGEQELAALYAEKAKSEPVPIERLDRSGARTLPPASASSQSTDPLEAARRLITGGKLQEAVTALRATIAADARHADAYLLLGTALALVPSRSEAIAALTQAVQLRPEYARGHFMLASALARFNEFEQARRSYDKALELDPGLAEAHVQLAMVQMVTGQVDAAITHLSTAVAQQGNSADAATTLYLRAKVYQHQKEWRKAVDDLEQAVRFQPTHPKAWLDLGLVRVQLGDQSGATESFLKAVEVEPKDSDAQFQLGSQYLRAGDATRAVPHLRAAADLRPNDRTILYALARALQTSGDAAGAAPILERLGASAQAQTQAEPNLVESGRLNNEGVALEAEGKFAEALERYRAALKISPDQVAFRRNLALVLCRLNRWEEAVPELKRVLQEAPGDVNATKALYIALERVPHLR